MANVLVVDDSKVDRILVEELLADGDRLAVQTVETAREALARLASGDIELVVTDLVMPEMDGLELTKEVRRRRPGIPVILMTAKGSEQVAVDALKAGAASYVPKDMLAQELRSTIERVLDVVSRVRERERLKEAMRRSVASFVIPNDTKLIRIVVKHLQDCTSLIGIGDETTNTQIGVALQEALINAALHGNLEVGSELRESDMCAYENLLKERAAQPPYRDRAVHVEAQLTNEEARFVIRDEGPGFDPSTLPDPRHAGNLHKVSGRGVLLMRAFMDEVTYNHSGNEVTLVKRRA
jgi:CheY-like chemotaxis protein